MSNEMKKLDDMYKLMDELQEYADLDGTEWGEQVTRLTNMWQSRTLLSDEFIKALETEIKTWLIDVKENAEIVEELITPDNKPFTVKSLEWI